VLIVTVYEDASVRLVLTGQLVGTAMLWTLTLSVSVSVSFSLSLSLSHSLTHSHTHRLPTKESHLSRRTLTTCSGRASCRSCWPLSRRRPPCSEAFRPANTGSRFSWRSLVRVQ